MGGNVHFFRASDGRTTNGTAMGQTGLDAEHLERLVGSEVALHGFELVEAEVLRGGGRVTLRFRIDKPGGVNIDECAAMDRARAA